jgi:L-threonylcarbamoyladenylate synthase
MKIIKNGKSAINEAVEILKEGGLVIYPTETVYGIGADATNHKAIEKLNNYKKRPLGKPYSIAVTDSLMAEKFAVLNKTAKNLYKQFLPGPLTVVSTGKHNLAKGVESEFGTLGIRIPNYKLVLNIVNNFGKPITATSANASYKKRPYKITDILENISEKQKRLIDLVIDAGTLPPNEPSTVIDTTLDDPVVLRQGNIKIGDKTEVLSRSPENTQNLAKELWQKYEKFKGIRPIVFALEGEMGVGKTIFTKGLAKAIGVEEVIVSPTFSLLEEYFVPNQPPTANPQLLTHIDTWRMEDESELLDLGFNEILRNNNAVVSVEWAEKVVDVLREHSEDTIIVWVKIKYSSVKSEKTKNERIISWGNI